MCVRVNKKSLMRLKLLRILKRRFVNVIIIKGKEDINLRWGEQWDISREGHWEGQDRGKGRKNDVTVSKINIKQLKYENNNSI